MGAALILLAGCAEVSADPAPTPPTSNEPPVSVVAPEPEPTIVVAPVVEPDPERCMDGTPFVRMGEVIVCGSELKYRPLVPMTLDQMIDAVGLPPIFRTTIVPRECGRPCNPAVVNDYGCVGPTQHCGKRAYYERRGYSWPEDAKNPWPHLIVTKDLYDELGLQPWTCGRCSLKR